MNDPRFDVKDPAEKVVLTFDFSLDLEDTEALVGSPTVEVTPAENAPTDTADIQQPVAPTLDSTNKKVYVPVQKGTDGCSYFVHVTAPTNNVLKVLAMRAILPVQY